MPEILDTSKAAYAIERILSEADETLIILSPVLQLTEKYFTLLKDTSDRNVNIKLVFGVEQLPPEGKMLLSSLKNIEICNSYGLTSKCYSNEKEIILTSLDLHDFHERNTGDISILLMKEYDPTLFEKGMEQIEKIYTTSVKIVTDSEKKADVKNQMIAAVHGFCIRCAMPISYNKGKPFCRQCFNEFSAGINNSGKENYCHRCAEKTPSDITSPLCHNCSL